MIPRSIRQVWLGPNDVEAIRPLDPLLPGGAAFIGQLGGKLVGNIETRLREALARIARLEAAARTSIDQP